MSETLCLFGLNFAWNFLLAWNFRVVAAANYIQTFVSDVILAGLAFTIFKSIQVAPITAANLLSYTIGAGLGAICGVAFTKVIMKK